MSPQERQEALMGGLTIQGFLEEVLDAGLAAWRQEEEEIGHLDMQVLHAGPALILCVGAQRWRIQMEEIHSRGRLLEVD